MLKVSSAEKAEFVTYIRRHGVKENLFAPYVRWMGYYLDFCHKYNFAPNVSESLTHFIKKLDEKKQTKEQQHQAANAITLYRDVKYPRLEDSTVPRPLPPAQKGTVEPSNDRGINQPLVTSTSSTLLPPIAFSSRLEKPATGASWKAEFDALANEIRLRHYSPKTLKTYHLWMRKFQAHTRSKPPESLTPDDVKNFLTWLAVQRGVAASTQNQAFNALLFMFRHVLHKEFGKVEGVVRAKRKPYIPVVLSREEITEVISHLTPPYDLVVKLLYGCGLRLAECLHLRVQCLNFDSGVITVHDGKGQKDRTVPLPAKLEPEIRAHLQSLKALHAKDLERNYAGVFLVNALDKKYTKAAREFVWQWLFPAPQLTKVPESGEYRRYYLHETKVQKAIKLAVNKAKLYKRASAHTFRHSFASHLLQANYDIRTIQELLGHSDVRTTMIYTHTVKSQTIKEAKSPLDF